jgi:hypothetical protein
MLKPTEVHMASDPLTLIRVCQSCGLIHDDGETAYERWVTKDIYKRANGMVPPESRLTYTYCPDCFIEVASRLKAA